MLESEPRKVGRILAVEAFPLFMLSPARPFGSRANREGPLALRPHLWMGLPVSLVHVKFPTLLVKPQGPGLRFS
jgi:hypothetical protein